MKKLSVSVFSLIWIGVLIYTKAPFLLSMVSALALHELGHLIFACVLRLKIKKIRLVLTGAQMELEAPFISYKQEFYLAFGGPFFSLLGFLLFFPLPFSIISLSFGTFNLIPVKTLDGGRMLYCFTARFFGMERADRVLFLTTFLSLFSLWCLSVYLMMRYLSGLSLFVFSCLLFIRFFLREKTRE